MVAIVGRNWRLAPSLVALFDQVDEKAPNRSTASDGSIGDTSHQARASDHNPDETGDVLAGDITHDPKGGFDAHAFAEQVRIRRDPRVKYVISQGRMFSSYGSTKRPAWQWGTYTGPNGHFQHVHISVLDTPFARSDQSSWFPKIAPQPPAELEDDDMTSPTNCVSLGNIYRAIQGTDGKPWIKIGSGPWAAFNGSGGRPNAQCGDGSSPSLCADPSNGTVVLTIAGTDKKLYESSRPNGGGNWTAWAAIGGEVA
jgi:hypothetical protein